MSQHSTVDSVGSRWWAMLWAALLLALGAVALAAGWNGAVATALLVATGVAPILVFALGAWLRVPAPITALVVLGLAAGAAYLFVLAPDGIDVTTAVRDSLPRLLTARRPAPADPALLLPGLVTALLVGVWVALRAITPPTHGSARPYAGPTHGSARPEGQPAGTRGRGLVAAPAGAMVLYTGGALLTAGTGDGTGVLAGAIVAVSAAGWLGLERIRRVARRASFAHRLRSATSRPLTVALAAGIALAVTVVTQAVDAFEPRNLVDPPQRTISEASPLPLLAAWAEQGDTELFRVTPTDGEMPTRLRLVTLSVYTGVAWSATATYRPVGVVGDTILPAGRERTTSAAVFTIQGLQGLVWLPGLGHPVDLSMSNVDYEAEGGSLALVDGEASRGLRYRLIAEHDAPSVEQITTAGVPSAEAAGPLAELPRLPAVFAEYARQITFGASTPFEEAAAIERDVRQRPYNPAAPVGSNYARLLSFLFPEEDTTGARGGSSEQFAAAFAVLARSVGLPTRVVLGFKATADGVVRGRDALAWPEVYFSGYGWYPFDPTPGTADPDIEEVKLLALDRMDELAEANAVLTSPPPAFDATRPEPVEETSPAVVAIPAGGMPNPLAPIAAAATVIVLAFAVLVMLRVGRRARHRRVGVRGAWSEVLDLLVLMGRPAPRTRTATDVAADLAAVAPLRATAPLPATAAAPATTATAHPALLIAVAADRAAFGPDAARPRSQRGQGRRAPGPEAAAAWSALRVVRRAVRGVVPLRRRLLWTVDPRPLRRRPRR